MWNEPDWTPDWHTVDRWKTNPPTATELPRFNGSIFDYVRMLRVTWQAAKKADPNALVATGGVGYPPFLDAILRYTPCATPTPSPAPDGASPRPDGLLRSDHGETERPSGLGLPDVEGEQGEAALAGSAHGPQMQSIERTRTRGLGDAGGDLAG